MSFIWPAMLGLLVLVPVAGALYLGWLRRRRRWAETYSRLGLTAGSAAGRGPGWRRHVSPVLFLLGLAVLLVALARPQAALSLPRQEGTVILAFDVSGSMAADDVKPTRIEAAKAAAKAFVQSQPRTVQIGVVAFSDNGFSVQAPSNEQDTILAAINRLTPQRGTSLAQGIQAALKAIAADQGLPPEVYSNRLLTPTPTPTPVPQGTYTSAVIVLLTDGENNENPDPLAAAQAAADRGVRIQTVGLGSPGGTTLKINGFTVHTQLDEALLQQIAQMTGGTYHAGGNAEQLRQIYQNLGTQLVVKPEETEVTALLAGLSLLIWLGGGVLALIWFGRVP